MSYYTSENTHVLATHMQDGNRRMLLLHICGDGRHEYVIGSYFTETPCARISFDPPNAVNYAEYSWDWGHYFNGDGGFMNAARFWEKEVLGVSYGFEAYDERSGFTEGELFDELGDAIEAYVGWDFLDGGSKKRVYSMVGEDQTDLVVSER